MGAKDKKRDQNHHRGDFGSLGKLHRMIYKPSEEKATKNHVSEINKVAKSLALTFRKTNTLVLGLVLLELKEQSECRSAL